MKSSHINTEPLWDKVNFKLTILLRMIDTCLEFLEKSLTNFVRKKFATIKQLIELN